jgi:hypothetical protein
LFSSGTGVDDCGPSLWPLMLFVTTPFSVTWSVKHIHPLITIWYINIGSPKNRSIVISSSLTKNILGYQKYMKLSGYQISISTDLHTMGIA